MFCSEQKWKASWSTERDKRKEMTKFLISQHLIFILKSLYLLIVFLMRTTTTTKNVKILSFFHSNKIKQTWQSILSITPPWPGINESKSLISYVLLMADAKKPPKGATTRKKKTKNNGQSGNRIRFDRLIKPRDANKA